MKLKFYDKADISIACNIIPLVCAPYLLKLLKFNTLLLSQLAVDLLPGYIFNLGDKPPIFVGIWPDFKSRRR